MNYLPQMYKALVPVAVGATLSLLSYFNMTATMTLEEALTLMFMSLATSVAVYIVPNKE